MKALTVRQPWAWAIVHAGKDIENRSWKSQFRGQIAIHASAKIATDVQLPKRSRKPYPHELICGAIIGVVDILGVVDDSRSKWFEGPYGFVLANPRPLSKPIFCKGRLSLWDLPPDVSREVEKRLARKN